MFNLKQAATRAGITEGLLIFWISTGKFLPSVELSTANHTFSWLPKGTEIFGWDRFALDETDLDRLCSMAERAGEQKIRVESSHIKGAHYTVQELAALWGLSPDTIRELFEGESGVLSIGRDGSRSRRRYRTLRIPEAVASRVQRKLSAG
jgi:hypothetical protein